MHTFPRTSPRSLKTRLAGAVALVAGLGLTATTLVLPAEAATPTVGERPAAAVTADALPTAQMNGVVWKQTIAGNTVFAGGKFTYARPSGASESSSKRVRRYNLMAFDIRTGKIKSFAPKLNGEVRSLATSPNGKILYVGGNFTKVGSKNRPALAAFDVATGKLRSTTIGLNNRVNAITTLGDVVYFGGWFTRAGKSQRLRAAAINVRTGKLTSWNPKADGAVEAMVATRDKKRIIIGGSFAKLGPTTALGMGAVLPTSGAARTWKANRAIKDYGRRSAILSLAVDKDTVYGSGYGYEAGNFEGVFAASQTDGTIKWLQDCHGDHYSVAPIGNLVYSVSHAHHCANIGGFGERNPQRALVVSRTAKGTVATNSQPGTNYRNWAGYKAPQMYNWFPTLNTGKISGSTQGAWSVVGNSKYVVLGGEFTLVNGKAQQGLTRFTTPANKAPQKMGPRATGKAFTPGIFRAGAGGLKVGFNANYDLDDKALTYQLIRNGKVVQTIRRNSMFYKRPWTEFYDASANRRGTKYTYQVRVYDNDKNRVTSPAVSVTYA